MIHLKKHEEYNREQNDQRDEGIDPLSLSFFIGNITDEYMLENSSYSDTVNRTTNDYGL
ncbi:MAG: hypothetical protein K0R93_2049 [Anaerosolibacter sp.]|jgi:hypothetical protein|uniref:hypothetical protein n=1 Tax=Anaerosolibacter sp. TaxID=1872527 RepID=UPI00262350B6|nr:hypothetical protein [Anaerosolibacter sp.]MDF2547151.1 hypothetical protein [Anaerosolibacter sp.]